MVFEGRDFYGTLRLTCISVFVAVFVRFLLNKSKNINLTLFGKSTFGANVIPLESSGEHVTRGISVGSEVRLIDSGIHVVSLSKERVQSIHVGYIEDYNRIAKLSDIDKYLTGMGKHFPIVGIVANGGTHKKPALTRIRDDIALEMDNGMDLETETTTQNTAGGNKDVNIKNTNEFSLLHFFSKYGMGKFLSLNHGCFQPYLMMFDVRQGVKTMEKIGSIGKRIKTKLEI